MYDEEIKIDDAAYTVKILGTEAGMRAMWACKACGCGGCSTTRAPEEIAIQLAKAIIEEHHRLRHAPQTTAKVY
jgi:hypothetical protein